MFFRSRFGPVWNWHRYFFLHKGSISFLTMKTLFAVTNDPEDPRCVRLVLNGSWTKVLSIHFWQYLGRWGLRKTVIFTGFKFDRFSTIFRSLLVRKNGYSPEEISSNIILKWKTGNQWELMTGSWQSKPTLHKISKQYFSFRLEIDHLWLIDWFGGGYEMPLSDYFSGSDGIGNSLK